MAMVNEKHLFVLAGVLVIAFAGFMVLDSSRRAAQNGAASGTEMDVGEANLKEFTITARRFAFEPSTITVNKGDRVRITLKSADVSHGIAISEFGVNAAAAAGEAKTVEFTADRAGTFSMFCSVYCGEGHPEMSGKLVVQDDSAPQLGGGSAAAQVITLRGTPYGYDKSRIDVRAGTLVRLDFSADPRAGCGRQVIIDNVGVNLVSKNGETVSALFTPPSPGVYRFHCSMNMFRGELVAS